MAPHFTYYIKVAKSVSANPEQDVFWIGTGDGSWAEPWVKVLDNHSDCPNQKIYKFDQSDSSNVGHPFNLSLATDGTHGTGIALGTGDGVTPYGVPGSSGASTKFNVGWFVSGAGHTETEVYPYCSNHSGLGDISSFEINTIYGDSCTDGDYSGEVCDLGTSLSGQLQTLISETNAELSGKYGDFTILSYSVETGKATGSFFLCEATASGATSGDSVSRLTNVLQPHFSTSGVCLDELAGGASSFSVNNINVSFGDVSTISGAAWYSSSSGFADARYYVGYNPQISGYNTGITVSTACPTTDIQVQFNRNKLIYDTTGLISLPEDTITQFITALNATCTGFKTTLDVTCLKYYGGQEKLGKITFEENIKDAWSGHLSAGEYSLKYSSGSFVTSLGMHTLGSGTIKADKYV